MLFSLSASSFSPSVSSSLIAPATGPFLPSTNEPWSSRPRGLKCSSKYSGSAHFFCHLSCNYFSDVSCNITFSSKANLVPTLICSMLFLNLISLCFVNISLSKGFINIFPYMSFMRKGLSNIINPENSRKWLITGNTYTFLVRNKWTDK